jgi:uncharacterized protein
MAPSGFFAKPTALEPSDVLIGDVAHHLSQICRFTGGTREPYSVAQHCVLVSWELQSAGFDRRYTLAGLLHDASEAYVGDFAGPLKSDDELGPAYKRIEHKIQAAIEERFGLPDGSFHWIPVKRADEELLAAEGYWLMPSPGNEWARPTTRWLNNVITPWPSWLSERRYLDRFMELTNGA